MESHLHHAVKAQPSKEDINKALRYNKGKLDWTLLDFEALEPLVKVMVYGAKKYTVGNISGRDNWKKQVEPKQHLQSAMRHLIAIIQGEEIDKESGERHSGHLLANMMMYNYHTKDIEVNSDKDNIVSSNSKTNMDTTKYPEFTNTEDYHFELLKD